MFMQGAFLTHPVLDSFLYVGSFSYTSRAAFTFIWVVSLTHPVLVSVFIRGISLSRPLLASFSYLEFLLHVPCCLYFSVGSFPYTAVLASFFFESGEFLLHIPCWLQFYERTFS